MAYRAGMPYHVGMISPRGAKASLHDVAKAAGVSVSTASRAFSAPEKTSAETRSRILEAAATLGYHPNIAARNLRLGQPRTLLAVLPNYKMTTISTVMMSAQVGIGKQARDLGYAMNMMNMDSTEATREYALQLVFGGQVSGTILMAEPPMAAGGRNLLEAGLPVVSLSEDLSHLGIPSVVSSDRQSMQDAVHRLADLGHEAFLFIAGPSNSYHSRQREAGVRSAMIRRFGSDKKLDVFRGDFSVMSGVEAAGHFQSLTPRPSAVICWADEPAIGFQSTVLDLGFSIPRDLSLISFDGLVATHYMSPPISTFDQELGTLAAHATRLLIDMIENGGSAEGKLIEFPATLLEGKSVGPPTAMAG